MKSVRHLMTIPRPATKAANGTAPEEICALRHELRTPLAGMLGLLSLLRDSDLTDDQQLWVGSLQSASNHLASLVDEVLSPTGRAAASTTTPVSFDLPQLICEVVGLFAQEAASRGIQLRTEIDELCAQLVWGDPIRLRQVVVNLVSNAVKFTSVGSVTVKLKVLVGQPMYRFEVLDTGCGFEPKSVHLLRPRPDGSGIGLAISRGIVEGLGGRLVHTGRGVGRGTTAMFTVPLPSASARRPHFRSGVTAEVLLVEDDPVSLQVVEHLLSRLGHSVTTVTTGLEALAACDRRLFDLVLLDGQLPDMTGTDVVRELRARELRTQQHQPIVALTATATAADRARCLAAGMNGYLSKPTTMAELAATVDHWLVAPTELSRAESRA
jgi:CheY-like chemotaxis protein